MLARGCRARLGIIQTVSKLLYAQLMVRRVTLHTSPHEARPYMRTSGPLARWGYCITRSHASVTRRQTPSRADMPHADHALTHAAPAFPGAGSCLERAQHHIAMPLAPRQVSELCTFRLTPASLANVAHAHRRPHSRGGTSDVDVREPAGYLTSAGCASPQRREATRRLGSK